MINKDAPLLSAYDNHSSKHRKRSSHVWAPKRADEVEVHDIPAQSLVRPPQCALITVDTLSLIRACGFGLSNPAPIPSIGPSDTYRVLGVKLNTSLTFNKQWLELKRTTASLITALSTSPLTQSRRLRVIRELLIGKHFTL
jgi:hypothetical protein